MMFLQVKHDYMCLYCNINCQPLCILEAVRKHMVTKGQCSVHYGDSDVEEEAELEKLYDYSSRCISISPFTFSQTHKGSY